MQSVACVTDNEILKGVPIKHQILEHYSRLPSFFFLTKSKDVVVYYSLSGSHIVVLTKSYKKTRYLCKHAPFKYFREYWQIALVTKCVVHRQQAANLF